MVYRALYRAYRPQSFAMVAGQKHVTRTLKNAILEDRISHAYLFCGPRGTGKTSIAKIFAKAVNCEHPVSGEPCNTCPTCQAITNGDNPDIIEIDAASNNGVNDARELIDKVRYAPMAAKYKVYIIDEVHMMSPEALNALLKTLEEPPGHVIFILATTEPHKILPTIISRCQRFDFTRLSKTDILSYLNMVLKEEKVTYEKEAAELIATLAEGGMRDALSILEQCLDYSGKTLKLEDVRTVFGITSLQDKIDFILHLLHQDMGTVLRKVRQMNENGTDLKRLTAELIDILKDVIIYKNTADPELLTILDEEHLKELDPFIATDECFSLLDVFCDTLRQYRDNGETAMIFEIACLKICSHNTATADVVKAPEPVIENINKEQKAPESVADIVTAPTLPVPEPETDIDTRPIQETAEPVSTTDIEHTEEEPVTSEQIDFRDILNILVQAQRSILIKLQKQWPDLKKYMADIKTAKYASMLSSGAPAAAGEHGLIIACSHEPDCHRLNNPREYADIKKFLCEFTGGEYDYIAVTKEQFVDIRNSYLKLRQAGKLPQPKPITLSHIQGTVDEKKDPILTKGQKFAIDLFGDIVQIVDHRGDS